MKQNQQFHVVPFGETAEGFEDTPLPTVEDLVFNREQAFNEAGLEDAVKSLQDHAKDIGIPMVSVMHLAAEHDTVLMAGAMPDLTIVPAALFVAVNINAICHNDPGSLLGWAARVRAGAYVQVVSDKEKSIYKVVRTVQVITAEQYEEYLQAERLKGAANNGTKVAEEAAELLSGMSH